MQAKTRPPRWSMVRSHAHGLSKPREQPRRSANGLEDDVRVQLGEPETHANGRYLGDGDGALVCPHEPALRLQAKHLDAGCLTVDQPIRLQARQHSIVDELLAAIDISRA